MIHHYGGRAKQISFRWDQSTNFAMMEVIECRHTKKIWRVRDPSKLRIFLWQLAKNAILTWDNLQKSGWIGPSICALFRHEEELVDQIMLH